jgi:gas vesicle protein
MDTKTLISEAKARFNHNSAKAQLKDKYDGKFIIAEQGGLWKASPEIIAFLNTIDDNFMILIDNFNNPVQVNREQLLNVLKDTYQKVMLEWYKEWKEIETVR